MNLVLKVILTEQREGVSLVQSCSDYSLTLCLGRLLTFVVILLASFVNIFPNRKGERRQYCVTTVTFCNQ